MSSKTTWKNKQKKLHGIMKAQSNKSRFKRQMILKNPEENLSSVLSLIYQFTKKRGQSKK